ncbi:SDR family NAD(P)-dependent oxidoreductase [Paenibacillus sp. S28]|uniref:SDR family NAD(P)-dependent oxidoreductase n=2 Tax=Bacillales TaxID=1385 RepID=UPI00190AFBCE|nr:SDR family NAD(P)-dependent oxidoreductase [Paenibacillus sp. S28]MBJ9987818.1 SDR family NAD(P)-dependent oxidoreductase [Paenibacillus sp. S28]
MDKDIAIIGMACRFPGAQNYDEFWDNLKEGRSSIQEIPKERWDWRDYWGDPQSGKNKSNSKWGGFIRDADAFDPAFFGLSAREVEVTDPQQRIMLELSWACLEDAGVRPSEISGEKIGVYMGVFNFDYKGLQESSNQTIETYHSIGTASAVIANRISHYFNLKGPSFPIDTACSSSFNAIHAAAQSLQLGECQMALAGGVSLILTPSRHISFSKAGMLSPTGSCKTFDDSADGYVRSEGAGVVLLKPLNQAVADGDPIYGVLKGSAVNHSGKTHTLTYPNPDAQAEVIVEAHQKAGIPVDSISYIEAHGTGTPKGDPMEFHGLVQAFEKLRLDQDPALETPGNSCGLGSVKANIGHLESAAGIAGVIKVLMSMKHKQLPGLHNFKKLNHRISMKGTPFYIVDGLRPWEALTSDTGEAYPRRAGISSFGFGGTNSHVVLEEAPPKKRTVSRKLPYCMVCLSGKTEEALGRRLRDLLQWLERQDERYTLTDISATLLLRREHFGIRGAFIVRDIRELRNKITQVLAGNDAEGWLTAKVPPNRPEDTLAFESRGNALIKDLRALKKSDAEEYERKLKEIADLYVHGYEADWKSIFPASGWKHAHLPTYPFARERYWLPEVNDAAAGGMAAGEGVQAQAIHPLLHTNTSDLREQRYSAAFTGQEFFLADHQVNGERIFPGVAYLEMARAAVICASRRERNREAAVSLRNLVWSVPVKAGADPVRIHIGLHPEGHDQVAFEIYSENEADADELTIHSQGTAYFVQTDPGPAAPVREIAEQAQLSRFTAERCYAYLRSIGLDYGPALRGIAAVYPGKEDTELFAKLSIPESIRERNSPWVLHPAMMDSALQVGVLLLNGFFQSQEEEPQTPGQMWLPFALDELLILQPCQDEMWARIRYSKDHHPLHQVRKVDLDWMDGEGNVCVSINGLSWRHSAGQQAARSKDTNGTFPDSGLLLMEPFWKEESPALQFGTNSYREHLIVLCGCPEDWAGRFAKGMDTARILDWQNSGERCDEHIRDYAERLLRELQLQIEDKTPGRVLIQLMFMRRGADSLLQGLGGMLKTAILENPKLTGQMIEVDTDATPDKAMEYIRASMQDTGRFHIRYLHGSRSVMDWKSVEAKAEPMPNPQPWKNGGVYVITGGLGGLGFRFAKEIGARVKNATIILSGRSSIIDHNNMMLEELRSQGTLVEYVQSDITDKDEAHRLVQKIVQSHGTINGIIHAAGLIRDSYLIHKTVGELQDVLAPKVTGLINLDESSRHVDLDFFVMFSSVFGPIGNSGQADYCTANAFMDAYAAYRDALVSSGERSGHTLSVNWPLWKDGGMQVTESIERSMLAELGMAAMQSGTGLEAFYQAYASGANQVLIVEGNPGLFYSRLTRSADLSDEAVPDRSLIQPDSEIRPAGYSSPQLLQEQSESLLKQLISGVLKTPASRIDAEAPMEQYGIDSIMTTQLTRELEKTFGSLSKTLFFEYQNIRELTGYFLREHRDSMLKALGGEERASALQVQTTESKVPVDMDDDGQGLLLANRRRPRFVAQETARTAGAGSVSGRFDVAVVGVAGRYPGAGNVNEFWEVLKKGRDCITEIPDERWDYRMYFDEDRTKPGKAYSKWGGFIDGVDLFDPLFFHISPREAELMDPQERLFLQCVYETMEDAGYTRDALADSGTVGVYVGSMYQEYQLYGAQEQAHGRQIALPGLPASIANRVSYFCNFHGPSLTIDTMCSSSLTAIHLACQSLQSGESDVCFAGGVNVSIHPNKYLYLSQGQFISSRGRCESFGQGGEGYVPGEGVGAVLLKPLAKAVEDGDQIYGVIKATAINHGGKTNGYTVPNPNAQAEVIGKAIRKAGIHPRAVSYVEAHGTGTVLGDPIEIAGLQQVFKQATEDAQFCAIGSAKSNIGHCESAAGIAGLTKVLLQLKHKQIVPSLHSSVLNPNIDFERSAFFVQQELAEWIRPLLNLDGRLTEYPRIAGISSFGAGGSNAHLVVEEYIPAFSEIERKSAQSADPFMIVLSARTEEQLKEQAQRLLLDAESRHYGDERLPDLAYTLQTGREAMEERLGLIVKTVDELTLKLRVFLDGDHESEGIYCGQVKRNKDTMQIFFRDEELQEAIWKWMERKKYGKLMNLWVKGLQVDWNKLYTEFRPRKMSLPTYPFARERYWVPGWKPAGELHPIAANFGQNEIRPVESQRKAGFWTKQWTPAPRENGVYKGKGRGVAVVATSETMSLARQVSDRIEGAVILEVDTGELSHPSVERETFEGVIDLAGCGPSPLRPVDWMEWIQQQIESRDQDGLRMLCVTRSLESFQNPTVNLAGADRAALYRMLQYEYSRLVSWHMDGETVASDEELAEQIAAEYKSGSLDTEVCYRNGIRYRTYLGESLGRKREESGSSRGSFAFPKEHVLWITGGTRGLGYACARHFVQEYGVRKLVLTGRETLPPREEWHRYLAQDTSIGHKIRDLLELESLQAEVHVLSVSLTDEAALQHAVDDTKLRIGPIGGVIHCAGIVDVHNPAFIRKSIQGIKTVLSPKMDGLQSLYNVMKGEELSFFVLYSSVSAAIPSLAAGQSDYAAANAYMDYFAESKRHECPLVSIQWPSWKETGMGEVRNKAYDESGLWSLTNEEGMQMLDSILTTDFGAVVLPASVRPSAWKPDALLRLSSRMERKAERHNPGMMRSGDPITSARAGNLDNPHLMIASWLKELLAEELKIDSVKLDTETSFQDYGVDSVMLAQLLRRLNDLLNANLEPTLLFEHPHIEALAAWLVKHHPDQAMLAASHSLTADAVPLAMLPDGDHGVLTASAPAKQGYADLGEDTRASGWDDYPVETGSHRAEPAASSDIAVVGMSCRFPGGESLEEYWDLLNDGRSAIRRMPSERWGYSSGYDAGWLNDIEGFDASYFLIPEADARAMDPQARMLLEESVKLICHAGYTLQEVKGKRYGVYLGARTQHSPEASALMQARNPIVAVGQNYLAANISQFLDFRGPSLVVDTACSSSLVGLHMAVQALKSGDIQGAVVGGIHLLTSDQAHRIFDQRGILNASGQFHLFDGRSAGIIPGEGAGMVLLKTVEQALADGDRIYAVIQGIAVNNDGRTAGPAAPNLQAQREVLREALVKSGKKAEDITYIEVNGSGTEVTDLLELKTIQSIYRNDSEVPLALGSIKPNIGHPLCAEGIAGLIKVVLMLHHGSIVPFLSGQQPMAHFDLQASPFYFEREATAWERKSKLAALNCFADGGTNVHVILEDAAVWSGARKERDPLPVPEWERRPKKQDVERELTSPDENPPSAEPQLIFWERFD